MTERIEQRYCIKFCQKLCDSQSKTIRKIQQVFGDDAMRVTQMKEWFNRFKNGCTSGMAGAKQNQGETVFFDILGIMHHEYVPEGQTLTKEYYQQVCYRLHDAVWRKRPTLWTAKNWQLHHDNTAAHSSHLIQTFLAKHVIPVIHQPPCSPDMAPCNFWLFLNPIMIVEKR